MYPLEMLDAMLESRCDETAVFYEKLLRNRIRPDREAGRQLMVVGMTLMWSTIFALWWSPTVIVVLGFLVFLVGDLIPVFIDNLPNFIARWQTWHSKSK